VQELLEGTAAVVSDEIQEVHDGRVSEVLISSSNHPR